MPINFTKILIYQRRFAEILNKIENFNNFDCCPLKSFLRIKLFQFPKSSKSNPREKPQRKLRKSEINLITEEPREVHSFLSYISMINDSEIQEEKN